LDQAIAEVNATRYGLGAALFSHDARAIGRFTDQVQAGVVKINDVPPGLYPHVSTGGWKASGLGPNELSEDGVDFFLHKKSVYLA
ncbi:aldehyde dehydrogenase family protein, partial [Bordetella bronchiseptica]